MRRREELCQEFARILRADNSQMVNGVCFATRMRRDLRETILGRTSRSPVAFLMAFSFEDLDMRGRALNLGEFVFTQEEVERFLDAITGTGIRVTAVHNHWLFEDPRLIYVHWESVMDPLEFARISSNALDRAILRGGTGGFGPVRMTPLLLLVLLIVLLARNRA